MTCTRPGWSPRPASTLATTSSLRMWLLAICSMVMCVSLNLIRQSLLVFRSGCRGRGAVLTPSWDRDPPSGTQNGDDDNDPRTEDHPRQGRFARAGQAARQCEPSLQDDGLQPGQLLPLQGAVRQRRRAGAAGDQPSQAGVEEPHRAGEPTVLISRAQAHPSLRPLAVDERFASFALRQRRIEFLLEPLL